MNGQYYGEGTRSPGVVEGPGQVASSPMVNTDPLADKVPVDASQITETPMGGTIASVGPVNAPIAKEIPMYETPLQEVPLGGTIAAVSPMNETIAHEAPVLETVPYQTPVVEAVPYQTPAVEAVPYQPPVVEKVPYQTPVGPIAGTSTALLSREETEHFRTRWNEIQGKFVDEPRTAVQQADTLVTEVIGQITQMFTNEHLTLEGQWKQGDDVSTEDLRKALQRYRSFFNRLVV